MNAPTVSAQTIASAGKFGSAKAKAALGAGRLRFNADAAAIGLAGLLALLVRFHVIGHIGW
jgi:hypothetical protein